MKHFEYKKEYIPRYYAMRGFEDKDPSDDTLKHMGENGWELCAVLGPDSGGVNVYYFKREKV
uniref:DUF4177 domain-containing protein n=1 Tax=viral metagenome TaxID=1070528 RepID=A0A6M3J076_9ZZZZ